MLKRKNIAILLLSVVICLSVIFVPLYCVDAKAEEASYKLDLEKCKEYTDDDHLNGADSDMLLEKYIENIESDYYVQHSLQAEASEHLKQIIPEEVFVNVGEYYYLGQGYSFYVNTWKPLSAMPDYISDVVIIDNTYDYDDETAEIKLRVDMFSRNYGTDINDGKSFISERGAPSKKYYLKDVAFSFSVENEHALNSNDEGYVKGNDQGVVIRQSRLNYGGIFKIRNSSIASLVKFGMDVFIPKIKYIGDIYNAFSTIYSGTEAIADSFAVESSEVECNNENNILTEKTKDAQKNDSGLVYRKSIVVYPKEEDLLINDYAETIVMLSEDIAESRVNFFVTYNLFLDSGSGDGVVINKSIPIRAENTYPDFDDIFVTSYEETLYETSQVAITGENKGYLLDEKSEQVFEFIPEKNGIYNIEAEGNSFAIYDKNDYKKLYSGNRFEKGKAYIIKVTKGNTANKEYCLNISFKPEMINLGKSNMAIDGLQTEFYQFTPDETGIYNFSFSDGKNLILQAECLDIGYVSEAFNANKIISIYMKKGCAYNLSVYNASTINSNGNMVITKGEKVVIGEETNINVTINKVFTFIPEYSGEYTLELLSSEVFEFSIYNSEYYKVYSSDVTKGDEYTRFYKEDEIYYIGIQNWVKNAEVTIVMAFTPPVYEGGNLTIGDIDNYNVVKFIPSISGKYRIVSDSELEVYNAIGERISMQNSIYVLSEVKEYYIVIKGDSETTKLLIVIDSEQLLNNTLTSVAEGTNQYAFTANLGGNYEVEGLKKYRILDSSLAIIYDETSAALNLQAGKTYYLSFNSADADNQFKIYFNPGEFLYYENVVIHQPTYFSIISYPNGEYTFIAKALLNQGVQLKLYDSNLNLLEDANDSLIVDLDSDKIYYLYVEIYNTDTMVYAESADGLKVDQMEYHFTGDEHRYMLEANDKITLKITYPQTIAATEYFLKINQDFNSQAYIALQYLDGGVLKNVELNSNGRLGEYFCVLKKEIGTYYLTIQTGYKKEFSVEFYVPTKIDGVSLNNGYNTVDFRDLINNFYFGKGKSYTFNINYNDEATYKQCEIRIPENSAAYTFKDGILRINPEAKIGTVVNLEFIANGGDDYKMYTFEISAPYKAEMSINDTDEVTVEIQDEFGNPFKPGSYSIKYWYNDENSNTQILVNNTKDLSFDLAETSVYQTVVVFADITVNGHKIQCYDDYRPTVITDFNSLNGDFSNARKIVVNVEKYTTDPGEKIKVEIPNNIVNLIIKGKNNIVYSDICFVFKSRTNDIIMTLYNFSFRTSQSSAIDVYSNVKLTLNIQGASTIRTTRISNSNTYDSSNAINAYNLDINGGTLTVFAGNANEVYYSSADSKAGTGLKVRQNLTVRNCTLTVYGGHGNDSATSTGYKGTDGGNAVDCSSMNVVNSRITLYGGNGSNGNEGEKGGDGYRGSNGIKTKNINEANGKPGGDGKPGQTGLSGGDGGYGLNISGTFTADTLSVMKLYGGNGGNGGKGGIGGNGGDGGTGADTFSRSGASANAGHGGAGGKGGNGGNGGANGIGGRGSNKTSLGSSKVTMVTGTSGVGGQGGKGGDGGDGGNGGADTQLSGGEGSGGNGGNGGDGGYGYAGAKGGGCGYGGAGGKMGDAGGNEWGMTDGKPGNNGISRN